MKSNNPIQRGFTAILSALLCAQTLSVCAVYADDSGGSSEAYSNTALSLVIAEEADEWEGEADAAQLSPELAAAEPMTLSVTHINPLYADILTEDDLVKPSSFSGQKPNRKPSSTLTETDNVLTMEEAASVMREGMKQRKAEIAVTVNVAEWSNESIKELMAEICDLALEHTGVPTEGDYLKWQYGGWEAQAQGSHAADGTTFDAAITYTVTYYTTAAQEKEVDEAVDALLGALHTEEADDYTAIRAIYDYICENITYDDEHLEADPSYAPMRTAYGALIDGTCVCQGYAVLLYRLALECGINARLISGFGNGGAHGWNILEMDDDLYYNADATWDAGSDAYTYFLVNDENFTDHTRDEEYAEESFYTAHPMGSENYHHWDEGVIVKEPTCMVEGEMKQICTICGMGRTVVLPKMEHVWDEGTVLREATCRAPGKKQYSCINCITTKTEYPPKLEHQYDENGICVLCGGAEPKYLSERRNVRVPYQTPVIDGDLSAGEWDEANSFVIDTTNGAAWAGVVTTPVVTHTAWDENGLYVAVEVLDDDNFTQEELPENMRNGDHIQIAFDPGMQIAASGKDVGGVFYSIGILTDGTVYAVYHPYGGNDMEDFDYTAAGRKTDTGWQFEILLPWSALECINEDGYDFHHAEGAQLAMQVCMLDYDDEKDGRETNAFASFLEETGITFNPEYYPNLLTLQAQKGEVTAPAAPEILSCYSRLQTTVKVTWTAAEGADGYEIWRATVPDAPEAEWERVKSVMDGSVTEYTNQGLTVGTTYYYKVRAFVLDSAGERVCSEFSGINYMPAAVVMTSDNPPYMPYSNSTSRVRLLWREVSGAYGYQIWRQDEEGGDFKIVKIFGKKDQGEPNMGNVTAYSNVDLTAGETYTYKMRAVYFKDDGTVVYGVFSDEFEVAVMPETPVVKAESPRAGRAVISWEAVNGADAYQVWMADSENGTYRVVKTLEGDSLSTSCTKYELESGKTYYFKVRATTFASGKEASSAFSDAAAVIVK